MLHLIDHTVFRKFTIRVGSGLVDVRLLLAIQEPNFGDLDVSAGIE